MYLLLLQQEDPCQPSDPRDPLTVTVQERQFSSGELKGLSIQPKSGTGVLVFAHSHFPSVSMSFPDSQYSVLLRLVVLSIKSYTLCLSLSVSRLSSLAFLNSHIFLDSIHPTLSLEM